MEKELYQNGRPSPPGPAPMTGYLVSKENPERDRRRVSVHGFAADVCWQAAQNAPLHGQRVTY